VENYNNTGQNLKGVHDVFFVFKGNKDLFNFDWWKFNNKNIRNPFKM
jgi:hypothetical protein